MRKPKIAVLLPCRNEEFTINSVVQDFKTTFPEATIFVFDNASTDRTCDAAHKAGAMVFYEPRKGKGNVVRRMFADIEADIYVLADGDGQMDAAVAPKMVSRLLEEDLDMVVGARVYPGERPVRGIHRQGHRMGNKLFTWTITLLFGHGFSDVLSGYRVFSRRFVKSIPINAEGFEIEAEITIHSLTHKLPVGEIPVPGSERPKGSVSKLKSFQDGIRILGTIIKLYRDVRPVAFFLIFFVVLVAISSTLGLVWKFSTEILTDGIMLAAFICLASGFFLETASRRRLNLTLAGYRSLPSVRKGLEVSERISCDTSMNSWRKNHINARPAKIT